jgi:hypothetical protein
VPSPSLLSSVDVIRAAVPACRTAGYNITPSSGGFAFPGAAVSHWRIEHCSIAADGRILHGRFVDIVNTGWLAKNLATYGG